MGYVYLNISVMGYKNTFEFVVQNVDTKPNPEEEMKRLEEQIKINFECLLFLCFVVI